MNEILNYIIHTYLFGIAFLLSGIYVLIDTVKNPIPNNETSPLQGNFRGYVFGIGAILLGSGIIIAKVFFNW